MIGRFSRGVLAVTIAVLLMLGSAAAWAQVGEPFALEWWVVAGGGDTLEGDQGYTLSASIGQPVVGPTLIGGGYSLSSGFWGARSSADPGPDPVPAPESLWLPILSR